VHKLAFVKKNVSQPRLAGWCWDGFEDPDTKLWRAFTQNYDNVSEPLRLTVSYEKRFTNHGLLLHTGLQSRRKNDTAPAPELLVFMSVAPAPELSFSWLRLQLRILFVFTH